jgi:hypothetical protein
MSINNIFTIVGTVIIVMVIFASLRKMPPPRRGQPARRKPKGMLIFTALLGVFIIGWSLLYDPNKGTRPACGMVTSADVEADFGWKILESIGSKSPAGDSTYCSYKLDNAKTMVYFVGACKPELVSTVRREPGAFDVSDLGDEAVSSQGTVLARKGLNCYSLGFEDLDVDPHETLEKRKNILRKVIARPIPPNN